MKTTSRSLGQVWVQKYLIVRFWYGRMPYQFFWSYMDILSRYKPWASKRISYVAGAEYNTLFTNV